MLHVTVENTSALNISQGDQQTLEDPENPGFCLPLENPEVTTNP